MGSMRRIFIDKQYVEIDMWSAHFQLLSRKYPYALAIREYISSRERHLEAVLKAAGIKCWIMKQLFIMPILGGPIHRQLEGE